MDIPIRIPLILLLDCISGVLAGVIMGVLLGVVGSAGDSNLKEVSNVLSIASHLDVSESFWWEHWFVIDCLVFFRDDSFELEYGVEFRSLFLRFGALIF